MTLMVGRAIDQLFPERDPGSPPRSTALSVRNVSQPGIVKNVSFDLKPGEVLGVSGLMGSGRSELARILFGLDPYSEGEIRVGEARLPPLAPRQAMDKGLAFLTEDRRGEGLMMEASITDNIVLPSIVERSSGFLYWLKPAALGVGGARRGGTSPSEHQSDRADSGADPLGRQPTKSSDREVAPSARQRSSSSTSRPEVSTSERNMRSIRSSTKWSPPARQSSLSPPRSRS